ERAGPGMSGKRSLQRYHGARFIVAWDRVQKLGETPTYNEPTNRTAGFPRVCCQGGAGHGASNLVWSDQLWDGEHPGEALSSNREQRHRVSSPPQRVSHASEAAAMVPIS